MKLDAYVITFKNNAKWRKYHNIKSKALKNIICKMNKTLQYEDTQEITQTIKNWGIMEFEYPNATKEIIE